MKPFLATPFASPGDPAQIDAVQLSHQCARNPEDHDLWSEFLRRFTGKIKLFIRGTLRRGMIGTASTTGLALLSGATETDLFQNVILRLVDNGCAALKRFSGTTEEELLAYFAVIARSAVRDFLRRQRALKRPRWQDSASPEARQQADSAGRTCDGTQHPMEREILARELERLSLQMIKDHSGEYSDRDRLIFQLYFFDGLSIAQISECRGIELSKTGVEKALDRLKDRVRCAAAGPHSIEALER